MFGRGSKDVARRGSEGTVKVNLERESPVKKRGIVSRLKGHQRSVPPAIPLLHVVRIDSQRQSHSFPPSPNFLPIFCGGREGDSFGFLDVRQALRCADSSEKLGPPPRPRPLLYLQSIIHAAALIKVPPFVSPHPLSLHTHTSNFSSAANSSSSSSGTAVGDENRRL